MKSIAALVSIVALVTPTAAAKFAALAVGSITSTGATTISGDVGVVNGRISGLTESSLDGDTVAGAPAASARAASLAAFTAQTSEVTVNLADTALDTSQTLTAANYVFLQGASINGIITLSGPGNFTFTIPSEFVETADSQVILADGATSESVVWNVGRDAVLGAGALLSGNLVAGASIDLGEGAVVDGTLTAGKNIVMDSSTVTV